jgi:hypothetical protein
VFLKTAISLIAATSQSFCLIRVELASEEPGATNSEQSLNAIFEWGLHLRDLGAAPPIA